MPFDPDTLQNKGEEMGAIESTFTEEQRTSGLHSRYRLFDEFNERDQTKIFQAMGFLGFFRRNGLTDLSFESACVLLAVAQRQSEGKPTSYDQWQRIL
ncbi:MAG: hypothetical protein R3194_13420, partial [Limnobacter sp.]|nr:hypothetical protein [Limnobacter sp.]